MKKIKILSLTILLLGLCFLLTPDAHAANKMGVIIYPKNGTTFYRGEVINYKAQVTNNHSYLPAYPWMLITKENSKEEAYKEFVGLVPGETSYLQGSFATKNIKKGTYYIVAYMNYFSGYDNVQGDYISNKIYIKNFKAPKSVKAKGKKKAVKLTYSKSSGASSYYIYKSTKKKKGYKLVATTNKTSYKVKKLKKKKTYYFKIKSVRNVNGSIKSSYSSVVSARTK